MSARHAWQDRAALALVAASVALSAALYSRLPGSMPVHFDLSGAADGWAPRPVGAFLGPAVALVSWLLVRSRARQQRSLSGSAAMRAVALLVVVLLSGVHVLALRAALGAPFATGVLAPMLSGVWIAFGLWMPRLRRNGVVGIRTPASLSSEEAWVRTHRLGSATFTLCGLAALALSTVSQPAAYAVLLAAALLPLVLSFPLARVRP